MRVIIAARLSQKVTAQTGIESQDVDAREWAENEGHEVIDTIADTASGTKKMSERQNLRPWVTDPQMMAKYDGIVAAKQDRLSRADWRDEAELRIWAENNHKTLFIVDRNLRWPPRNDSHHDDDVTNWNRGAEEAHREWDNTSRRYRRMHKALISDNFVTGRPVYGYHVATVDGTDHKTLVIFEPEAQIIREIITHYLDDGWSLQKIADDLNARHVPSPTWKGKPGHQWHPKTIGKMLRSPSIAGRRYPRDENNNPDTSRPPILRYDGIITWDVHRQLETRLDSRANRKGISPGNTFLLSGIMTDENGHPMYPIKSRPTAAQPEGVYYYYCRRRCGYSVPMIEADARIAEAVEVEYGHLPYKVARMVPGQTNFNRIAQLRQERSELDDMADNYDEKHAELSAEIRRLVREDQENPPSDTLGWIDVGKTIAEHWASLDTASRRDWLKANSWKVIAYRQQKPQGWSLLIDPGITEVLATK